jgi:hypothetical protein
MVVNTTASNTAGQLNAPLWQTRKESVDALCDLKKPQQ